MKDNMLRIRIRAIVYDIRLGGGTAQEALTMMRDELDRLDEREEEAFWELKQWAEESR